MTPEICLIFEPREGCSRGCGGATVLRRHLTPEEKDVATALDALEASRGRMRAGIPRRQL